MSGQALQEILLQEYGLQMEMASGNYVVAMTSIMDTDEGFARLSDALECIDGTVHKKEETSEISPREIYREQKIRHDDRSGTGRRTKKRFGWRKPRER